MNTQYFSKGKILGWAMVLILLAATAYGGWYAFNRQQKIAHNAECDRILSHSASSTNGMQVLPSCVYEIVPPTLAEKLTGAGGPELPRPILNGCDQSATTADCASLPAQSLPQQPQEAIPTTTAETVGNFSFSYPSGQGRLTPFGWEGVVEPGNYVLLLNGITNYTLYIFTAPSPFSSIKPNAASLDDYRTDYAIEATGTRQVLIDGKPATVQMQYGVHILSTADVVINGIPMLKQRYSMGYWQTDPDGSRSFLEDDEMGLDNELRYVFFDGKTFVVLTSWQAADSVDFVARTIHIDK